MADFLATIKLMLDKTGLTEGMRTVEKDLTKPLNIPFGVDSSSMSTTSKQIAKEMGLVTNEAAKTPGEINKSVNQMGDFEKAMRRALIVAPVWMAMRATMMFFTQGLKEGVDYLIQFEKQLLLIKQALPESLGNTEVMGRLKEQIMALAQETGKSGMAISQSFLNILKSGVSYQDAMAGAKVATEGAIVAQTDGVNISKALALAFKLQGDTLDSSLTPAEKYKQIMADMFTVSKQNLVSVDDLSKEYILSAASMQVLGLSFTQAISLLGTLNSSGVQNISGLRTGIMRLLSESDKIAPTLGIAIGANAKPIDILMSSLSKIKLILSQGEVSPAFIAVKDLFGMGGRGGGANITALAEAMGTLKRNLTSLQDPSKVINSFNQALSDSEKEVPHLTEQLNELKNQAFKDFITAVVGGSDFNVALKTLSSTMKNDVIPAAQQLGTVMHLVSTTIGGLGFGLIFDGVTKKIQASADAQDLLAQRIMAAEKGELTYGQVLTLISNIERGKDKASLDAKTGILTKLKEIAREYEKTGKGMVTTPAEDAKADIEKNKLLDEQDVKLNDLKLKTQDKLRLNENEVKYEKMKVLGANESQIAYIRIKDTVSNILDKQKTMVDEQGHSLPALDEHRLITDIIKGNYEDIIISLKQMHLLEEQMPEIEKARDIYMKAQITTGEKLITNELELLRIKGASNLALLQAEESMRKIIFGTNSEISNEKMRLETEKEITKEKLNQVNISNETVQLYKLAQKYGNEAAQGVGALLTGKTTWTDFKNQGNMKAFEEFFGNRAEEYKAAEWAGIPIGQEGSYNKLGGGKGFFGRFGGAQGGEVPISEDVGLTGANATKLKNQAIKQNLVNIDKIDININKADSTKAKAEKVEDALKDIAEGVKNNPKVRKAIEEIIDEH